MKHQRHYARIVGWGYYVPSKVLTNDDLAQMVDTTDEWIRTRTGIAERRIAAERESSATMAVRAAEQALEVAGCDPARLDLILVATATPDYLFPATACLVQDALGARRAGAFDLSAGCSGFVYALGLAADGIAAGSYDTALVIGAETLSRVVDWTDRGTCVLFGDGAGAVVLQASKTPSGVLATVLGADGSGAELLTLPGSGFREVVTPESRLPAPTVRMNGHEIYRFATRTMGQAAQQAVQRAGLKLQDIDLVIPHQANLRIIQSVAKQLKLPDDKVFVNLEHYGNTSAASIPIALCEAVASGRVKPDTNLVFVAFGAGLTWGASVVRWSPLPVTVKPPAWKRFFIWLRLRLAPWHSLLRRLGRRADTIIGDATGDSDLAPPPARKSGEERKLAPPAETKLSADTTSPAPVSEEPASQEPKQPASS